MGRKGRGGDNCFDFWVSPAETQAGHPRPRSRWHRGPLRTEIWHLGEHSGSEEASKAGSGGAESRVTAQAASTEQRPATIHSEAAPPPLILHQVCPRRGPTFPTHRGPALPLIFRILHSPFLGNRWGLVNLSDFSHWNLMIKLQSVWGNELPHQLRTIGIGAWS